MSGTRAEPLYGALGLAARMTGRSSRRIARMTPLHMTLRSRLALGLVTIAIILVVPLFIALRLADSSCTARSRRCSDGISRRIAAARPPADAAARRAARRRSCGSCSRPTRAVDRERDRAAIDALARRWPTRSTRYRPGATRRGRSSRRSIDARSRDREPPSIDAASRTRRARRHHLDSELQPAMLRRGLERRARPEADLQQRTRERSSRRASKLASAAPTTTALAALVVAIVSRR